MRKPVPTTGWKRPLEVFSNGLMTVLKPLQIVGNFVFLTVAYILGVGLSSLFYRLGPGRRARGESGGVESYWTAVPPAPRDQDAWLRPF